MRWGIWLLLRAYGAVSCVLGLLAVHTAAGGGPTSLHPYPLFPSRPVPGRTGVGTPEIDAVTREIEAARAAGDEERAAQILSEKLGSEAVFWGAPEFLPYPGSVEHVRSGHERYTPAYPIYNHKTLVRNFIFHTLPELRDRCVEFSEPIYYHTQWRRRIATSGHADPVRVYPWRPGVSVHLNLGQLVPRMMYAIRVIGALRTEDVANRDDINAGKPEKQLVFRLEINDGPAQAVNSYALRGRATDNFYEVVCFLFHCTDDRELHASLTLLPESETSLYAYNVDVHNIFGECVRRAGKKKMVIATPAERDALRRRMQVLLLAPETDLATEIPDQTLRALLAERRQRRTSAPLSPEQRARRDDDIWHSLAPLNYMADDRVAAQVSGGWSLPRSGAWQTRFRLTRAGEIYDWEDYACQRPLPGVGDRGWGVPLPAPQKDRRFASWLGHIAYWKAYYAGDALRRLSMEFHVLGDLQAARDAVLLLARVAYHLPAMKPTSTLSYADCGSPEAPPRRYGPGSDPPSGWGPLDLWHLLEYYDRLFDFIADNEELASAIGRFVPWVKTPDDVRWLFDVYLVQYVANEMTHYRYFYDHGLAKMLITAAAIQDDVEISRPWMEFLWRQCWEYPQTPAGLPDNIVTDTTCDGTTTIGSWSYTQGGNAGLEAARALEIYLRNGGDRKYDLSDFRLYPKSLAGVYFFFESTAAGGHYPGIGDVGGPSREYRWGFGPEKADLVREGWRLTRDWRFAWFLVHYFGRRGETDAEWAEITRAAAGRRDPYMALRSRVLPEWSAYLEGGTEHDDYRFRRAVAVRVGNGAGHAHNDTLDLRIWAHGLTMSGDLGQRPGYGRPQHYRSYVHNVAEVDGKDWNGYAWIPNLFDAPGARYLRAAAVPPRNHSEVQFHQRQVALVDVDEGRPSPEREPAKAEKDANVVSPNSYVFDVIRISGGRKHTYCFHGCTDLGFEVNVRDRVLLEEQGESEDEQYMRGFRWTRIGEGLTGRPVSDSDKQWAGNVAGDVLQATWRLAPGAEKRMNAGRAGTPLPKYTRLHLLDAASLRILHGIAADINGANRLNPDVPHYAGRCLYAQRHSVEPLETVFLALIEPFAGEAFIRDRRLAAIENNESDALRAVAVEVRTSNGHTDVVFADGRPERVRGVRVEGGLKVAGEFAFLSRDARGLRQATLSGGTQLATDELSLRLAAPGHEGVITKVDYLDRNIWVSGLPPLQEFAGQFFEIGNDQHWGTYEVDAVHQDMDGTTVLHLRKGLEIMRARVIYADYDAGRIKTDIAMLHHRGRDRGLVATGVDNQRIWRVAYEGGNRHEGHTFRLSGARISEQDFPIGGQLSVWEFGVGDAVRLPGGVSLRRSDADGLSFWEVYANIAFRVEMAGALLEWSADRKRWQRIRPNQEIGPGAEQPSRFFLRVLR